MNIIKKFYLVINTRKIKIYWICILKKITIIIRSIKELIKLNQHYIN